MISDEGTSRADSEIRPDDRPEAKRVSQRFTLADDDSVDVEPMLRGSVSLPRLEQEFGLAGSAPSSCSDLAHLEEEGGQRTDDQEMRESEESSPI